MRAAGWILLLLVGTTGLRAQSPAVLGEAALFIDRGQYADARRALARGLAEQPNQPTYLALEGLIHMKSGQYAQAEVSFRRALEHSPALSVSHFNLAEVLYLRGNPAEALPRYEAVEASAPFKPFALYKEVLCLLLTDQTDEAVKRALAIPQSEKDPAFAYAVAAVEFHRGRRDRALYFTESARRLYAQEAEVFRIPLRTLGWLP
jgi:tetratricopeptide (TPR) repeat protein